MTYSELHVITEIKLSSYYYLGLQHHQTLFSASVWSFLDKSLYRQLIALVLTTTNKETKGYSPEPARGSLLSHLIIPLCITYCVHLANVAQSF